VIIGITGPMGSGKSLVASELARLGAYVIDLDVIARELVEPGMPALDEIRDEFGPEYILEQGALDRKALGSLIFSDPEALRRLNRIMFPKLVEAAKDRLDKASGKYDLVVIDAAVLCQAGLDRLVDKVIGVTAEKGVRIERIAKRNKLSYEEASARVLGQGELDEILKHSADLIIDNSGSREALLEQLKEGLRHLGIDVPTRAADNIFPNDE
jgi:dephospho-CoA kinase